MTKRRKGIHGLAKVGDTATNVFALGIGGIGGNYVNKFGTYSPVLPNQAGPIANIVAGAIIDMMFGGGKGGFASNIGKGMVAVGFGGLAHSMGIGGNEFVNGTDSDAEMIANYRRQKMVNANSDGYINGDIINGLIKDNAVQADDDLN